MVVVPSRENKERKKPLSRFDSNDNFISKSWPWTTLVRYGTPRELRESIGTGSTQKRREDFKSKRLDEFLPLGVFQTQRGIINSAARNDCDFSTRKNKEQTAGGESLFTLIFFIFLPRLALSCLLASFHAGRRRKRTRWDPPLHTRAGGWMD